MAKSGVNQGGNKSQFTYDFGITIAQSTVNKISRLTGATLTLASAYYALKVNATEYVKTLRENTLRFGGFLTTIKAMEEAQNRLIKGQSYFKVDDQLKGMNQLMAAGINVGKNLEWINKAAHATGKSFSEFSGMIASAIQGNSQALVDAGLITQRATRMFDKYTANTIMRQTAILNFVKNHKGLMNAIKNDFETVQDQILRIKTTWQSFIRSVAGKPNDPQSFHGQITASMKLVAVAFSRNAETLRRCGFIIGQTLGWVIKQIGHFVVWVGRQFKKVVSSVWTITDDFQNQARSLLVWLEFWKLKVIDFFKEYGGEIKNLLMLLLAYKALKAVFVISRAAILSVKAYGAALLGAVALQKRYMASMGPYIGKTAKFFQSLAVWLPKPFRGMWVWMGKFFADFSYSIRKLFRSIMKLPAFIGGLFKSLKAMWTALNATNPVGWIILAITFLATLYTKSEKFRVFVNNMFKAWLEYLKLLWNSLMYLITWAMVGCKKVWNWFKTYIWEPVANFFKSAWGWIGDMWGRFMNTAVGKWINKWIVTPLKTLFQWIVDAWNWVVQGIAKAINWLSGANDSVSQATKELAEKNGAPILPTFEGGHYDTNDSTNYLNPHNWNIKNPNDGDIEKLPTGNPILAGTGGASGFGGGTNVGTSMTFNNGAIQIVVQKGDNIDERVLAQKVKGVINDMRREGDMRGGMV